MQDNNYSVDIIRGYNPINDYVIDWIKPKIKGKYLDIGCNSGWLLTEVPDGSGIDASKKLIDLAKNKGCNAIWADATCLPFDNNTFDTAVLSCILEQCFDWKRVLSEAIRCAKVIIGTNPMPNSKWGVIAGNVKSVISPAQMVNASLMLGCVMHTERMQHDRYYFEIKKNE